MNDYFKKQRGSEPPKGGSGGGNQPPEPPEFIKNIGDKSGLIYLILTIVGILFFTKPYVIINEGERGIKVTTGKYEPFVLEPGLHFLIPVIQRVIIVDTKIRLVHYKSIDKMISDSISYDSGIMTKAPITVLDKRGLPVTIELTVQYQLNKNFASQTISEWGVSWEEKIINPVVRDVVRNVVGSYEAEALPIKRSEIANLIDTKIRENIDNLKNSPAHLHSIQLREIVLPIKVKEQIERVQLAKQEVERAQQEVEKAKQTAFQKAELAKGDAEAKKIQAQGYADATIIEATAKAKANKLISDSLTPNLLALEQIQIQGEFNKALQVNTDAKIFLTPGGSTPNIWVDMKDKSQKTSTGTVE
jgi:regulator of protease activity HflC (stomatin/prohibitin superfamily)